MLSCVVFGVLIAFIIYATINTEDTDSVLKYQTHVQNVMLIPFLNLHPIINVLFDQN